MAEPTTMLGVLKKSESGNIHPTFGNALALMERHPDLFDGRFRQNLFSGNLDILDGDTVELRPVTDEDIGHVRQYFWNAHEVDFSADTTHKAIQHRGYQQAYHPVRDYLESVKWDGVERVPYLLSNYIGATDDLDLNATMGIRWMVGCVARIYEPGCKLDTMLVLQGVQGALKSSAMAILGGEWFSDAILDLRSKDASQQIEGVWIQEFGEMESVRKQEATLIKAWLSRRVERYRKPYARTVSVVKRQCVIVGTTNEDTFLSDKTGSRRFWIRSVPPGIHANLDLLKRDRDQLWAEARHRYLEGTQWWLTHDEDQARDTHAEDFRVRDPFEDPIDDGSITIQNCTTAAILDAMEIPLNQRNKTHEMRLSAILRARGFAKVRSRTLIEGVRPRVWRRT